MYHAVCFNRGTEAGWRGRGVNVGHSLSPTPFLGILCLLRAWWLIYWFETIWAQHWETWVCCPSWTLNINPQIFLLQFYRQKGLSVIDLDSTSYYPEVIIFCYNYRKAIPHLTFSYLSVRNLQSGECWSPQINRGRTGTKNCLSLAHL